MAVNAITPVWIVWTTSRAAVIIPSVVLDVVDGRDQEGDDDVAGCAEGMGALAAKRAFLGIQWICHEVLFGSYSVFVLVISLSLLVFGIFLWMKVLLRHTLGDFPLLDDWLEQGDTDIRERYGSAGKTPTEK